MLDLKKNKAGKDVMKATHLKQMGGVTVSDDGTTYTYPYIKNGQKDKLQGNYLVQQAALSKSKKKNARLTYLLKHKRS